MLDTRPPRWHMHALTTSADPSLVNTTSRSPPLAWRRSGQSRVALVALVNNTEKKVDDVRDGSSKTSIPSQLSDRNRSLEPRHASCSSATQDKMRHTGTSSMLCGTITTSTVLTRLALSTHRMLCEDSADAWAQYYRKVASSYRNPFFTGIKKVSPTENDDCSRYMHAETGR